MEASLFRLSNSISLCFCSWIQKTIAQHWFVLNILEPGGIYPKTAAFLNMINQDGMGFQFLRKPRHLHHTGKDQLQRSALALCREGGSQGHLGLSNGTAQKTCGNVGSGGLMMADNLEVLKNWILELVQVALVMFIHVCIYAYIYIICIYIYILI